MPAPPEFRGSSAFLVSGEARHPAPSQRRRWSLPRRVPTPPRPPSASVCERCEAPAGARRSPAALRLGRPVPRSPRGLGAKVGEAKAPPRRGCGRGGRQTPAAPTRRPPEEGETGDGRGLWGRTMRRHRSVHPDRPAPLLYPVTVRSAGSGLGELCNTRSSSGPPGPVWASYEMVPPRPFCNSPCRRAGHDFLPPRGSGAPAPCPPRRARPSSGGE